MLVTVHFVVPCEEGGPDQKVTAQGQVGESLVHVAKKHGVSSIHAACGQKLQCATCHVILPRACYEGLPPKGVREEDMLETAFSLTETSRLGCQVLVTPAMEGIEIRLPSKASKRLARMALDQPRPKVDVDWGLAVPAVARAPLARRRTSPAAMRPISVSSQHDEVSWPSSPLPERPARQEGTLGSEWERLYHAQRAQTAILEQRLNEGRVDNHFGQNGEKQRGKGKPAATSEGGNKDADDEEGKNDLEKLKEELKGTIVKLDRSRVPGFDDVVGLEPAKRVLRESILWPAIGSPELFRGIRGQCRGVLLFGPPGCGKTMVARAAAAELCCEGGGGSTGSMEGGSAPAAATFFHVRPSDVMSKFYGDSQKRILALEELAREHSPAIIFLDEVDTLLGKRDGGNGVAEHHKGVTNALLTWMDGFDSSADRVFFIGATNRANAIDEAALRRFGDLAEVGLPDQEQRRDLLENLVAGAARDGHKSDIAVEHLAEVAERTAGMSGDDVARLVQQAFLEVLREIPGGVHRGLTLEMVPPVTFTHFETSLKHGRSSGDVYKSLQKHGRVSS